MSYTYTTADIVNSVKRAAVALGSRGDGPVLFTSREFKNVCRMPTCSPSLDTLVKRGAVVVDHSETLSAKSDFEAIIKDAEHGITLKSVRPVFSRVTGTVMDALIEGVGLGHAACAANPDLREHMTKYGIDPDTLESEDGRFRVRFNELKPYTFKRNYYRFALAEFAAKASIETATKIADVRRESEEKAAEYARKIDALAADLAKLQDMASAA